METDIEDSKSTAEEEDSSKTSLDSGKSPISKLLLLKSIVLAMLSGLLLSVCFPGMGDVGGLVFIWAFPLFYTLFSLKPTKLGRKGFFIGLLCGLVFWLINLKWLLKMGELSHVPLLGAVGGWIALASYLAIYFAIFGLFLAKWGNPWRTPKQKVYANRIDAKIAEKLREKAPGKMAQSFRESMSCLRFAIMHASLWTILEWIRSILFTGFSWNGLGIAFHDIPVLAQTAELVGAIGLSFFPMFLGSVLFQLGARMIKEAAEGRMKPHWDMGVAGLILAGMFGFGVMRLYDITRAPSKEIGVLLVQQNIPLGDKHSAEKQIGIITNYGVHTEEGLKEVDELNSQNFSIAQKKGDVEGFEKKEKKVDLVLWPESTIFQGLLYFHERQQSEYVESEGRALKASLEAGAPRIITGANEYHFDENGNKIKSYNSIAVFRNQPGHPAVETLYQKNHLVMFGEYIPFRETFPFLEKLVGGAGDVGPNFLPGGTTEPMKIEHEGKELQLIGSVCFEDTVGRLTRKSIRKADQVIVNVTNDGWFGESEAPFQHFANARFRCIELRRPMVRSANTGISCVINAKGSIENEDGSVNAILDKNGSPFTEDTLYSNVRILTDERLTLYAVAGDWFVLLCAVFFTASFAFTLNKKTI